MIIVCPRCGLLYTIAPAELSDEPRTVRCSGCEWEWLQSSAEALPDDDEALRELALSVNGSARLAAATTTAARTPLRAAVPKPVTARPAMATPARPAPTPTPAPAPTLAPAAAQGAEAEAELDRPAAELTPTPAPKEEPVETFDEAAELAPDPAPDPAPPIAAAPVDSDPIVEAAAAPATEIESAGDDVAPEPDEQVVAAKALNARAAADDHAIPPTPDLDARDREARDENDRDRSGYAVVKRYKRPPTAVLAGGAIAATLLVAVGLLAATRGPIIATFPGAAGLYRTVGFSVPHDFAEGLEIRDVSSSRSWGDDGQVLTVEGDLANVAGQPRSLPMVRVVLVDGSDAEVQEVVVPPPSETLPVGETIRFEARINNPVETAKRIKVSLAAPQEPS